MSPRPFPSACRATLARLADLAEAAAVPSEVREHLESCERCARSVAASRAQVAALRALPCPTVPEALRAPAFLESIQARALADAEARLAPLLGEWITPVEPPSDLSSVDLQDSVDRGDVARALRQALPEPLVPGWIWSRIRADLDQHRSGLLVLHRQRRMRVVRLAAAAAIVLVASSLLLRYLGRPQGATTQEQPYLAFAEATEPLAEEASPVSLVRMLARDAK